MASRMEQTDSPLSAYLVKHTESDYLGSPRPRLSSYSGMDKSTEELDMHVQTLISATDTLDRVISPENRLKRALMHIKSLKELITTKLLPLITALRHENQVLSRQLASGHTSPADRSAEIVRSVDHLERRFYQSEGILKRTIEELKQQVETERISKLQIQQELLTLKTSENHVNLVNELREQMREMQENHVSELKLQLHVQELNLKEQHAKEMAQMFENYDFERQRVGTKSTATGEAKRLGEALSQIQSQNKFLLQLMDDKNELITNLMNLLEEERGKVVSNSQVQIELQQLRQLVGDLLRNKEGNLAIEKKNALLAAKLAVKIR